MSAEDMGLKHRGPSAATQSGACPAGRHRKSGSTETPAHVGGGIGRGDPLDAHAVYLSPTGRRCRWVPTAHSAAKRNHELFVYEEDGDGFSLRPENWALLRRVAG